MLARLLFLAGASFFSSSDLGFCQSATTSPSADIASGILDKHCARCHQVGKLKAEYDGRPKANFGYILDLPKLIDEKRIKPGNAAGSEIYIKIAKGEMPKDTDSDCFLPDHDAALYCGLSKDEQLALGAYIDGLRPAAPSVAARTEEPAKLSASAPPPPPPAFTRDADIIRAISADLSRLPDTSRANARYLTLTHFVNAPDTSDPSQLAKELDVYRAALAKLVNSLSSESDPLPLVAVDPGKTVLRIDIAAIGWSARLWDRIASLDPYLVTYDDPQFRLLQAELKTSAPFLRGDWFTHATSRPPLYDEILGLPEKTQELERKLQLDPKRDIETFRVARAGFQDSGVSRNNRMIERHTIATGAFWQSYDFASSEDRRSFFQFPLGPQGVLGDLSKTFGFTHDGGEIIFSLPNGLHAYYLTNAKGERLATGPTNIVQDPSRRDLAVTSGISCFGCHDRGIKFNDKRPGQPLDQVRPLVDGSGRFSKAARDAVDALFPLPDAFDRLMQEDAKRYATALDRAGVPMGTKINVEMINDLFDRFDKKLSAKAAAAELGLTEEDFLHRLDAAGGEAYDLKLRLAQDVVPRDQFEALFPLLVAKTTDNTPVDLAALKQRLDRESPVGGLALAQTALSVARPPAVSKTFDLAFFADRTSARVGDVVTFKVKSAQACNLTLIDTDGAGRSQVLFPNAFSQANAIPANATLDVPGARIGGFKFTADEAGREHVVAICTVSAASAVVQDLAKQDYTTFSNQRDLLDSVAKARLLGVSAAGAGARPKTAAADPDPQVPVSAQTAVVIDVAAK